MADMRICETLAKQASPISGLITMILGLEITCSMYSDVCLRYRVREMLLLNCR